MEDDGFKVVTYRKGKSWQKKSGIRLAQRIEGSLDDIRVALQKADSQIKSSGLSSWIIPEIKSIIGNRRIGQVYVVGNGHFDASWEPGAHQLALVLELCREFQAMMVFQDPCLSQAERNWLSEQKQAVSRDASDMFLDCSEDNVDSVLLLVLIHGLHGLLNDFLIANWHYRLYNIVIICNDYREIEFIGGTSEIESEFSAISLYRKIATFVPLPEYTPHPSFFLSSSIVYIDKDVILPELKV